VNDIWLFIDCGSGDMQAFASLDAYRAIFPDHNIETRNSNGDRIVQTSKGRSIGYLQDRPLRT